MDIQRILWAFVEKYQLINEHKTVEMPWGDGYQDKNYLFFKALNF